MGSISRLYEYDEHNEQREVDAAAAGQPTPPISSVQLRGPPSWTTSSQRLRLSPTLPMLLTQPRRRELSPVDRLRLSPSGRRLLDVGSPTNEQRFSPEEIRREIEMVEKQIEQLSTEKVREELDCLMISH